MGYLFIQPYAHRSLMGFRGMEVAASSCMLGCWWPKMSSLLVQSALVRVFFTIMQQGGFVACVQEAVATC